MAKIVKPRPQEPHPNPEHWSAVRSEVLCRDGYKCRLCGHDEDLHVHHLTYQNWGEEELDDLTTLCREHHKLFHKQNKKLRKKTPLCPECNDENDVVHTDQKGYYNCTYENCKLYFNEEGEILTRYGEEEQSDEEQDDVSDYHEDEEYDNYISPFGGIEVDANESPDGSGIYRLSRAEYQQKFPDSPYPFDDDY